MDPEDDRSAHIHRFAEIVADIRPRAFVMENVKGILSSRVGGERIFPKILKDLADPEAALGLSTSGPCAEPVAGATFSAISILCPPGSS